MFALMMMVAIALQPPPAQDGASATDDPVSPAMTEARSNRSRARTGASFIEEPERVRPEAAQLAGEFGEVVLSGIIGADGRLHEARVVESSRSAAIDAAALASVPNMLFEPARDAEGRALSTAARLPREYLHVEFHGPRGLANYRCDQFVRDYDWWYRTWPSDKVDRVFSTLRGFATVADMQSRRSGGDFATEWRAALEACRRSPDRLMLDLLEPHGALFRTMMRR